MSKLRVLVCRVGQEPIAEEIDPGLEPMQKIVGGYVECLGLEKNVDLWCNEEGRYTLPLNRRFAARAPQVDPKEWSFVIKSDPNLADPGQMGYHEIHGDFFVAGADNEEGETVSLPEAAIEKYTKVFGLQCVRCNERLAHPGAIFCGAACAARTE